VQQRRMLVALLAAATVQGPIEAGAVTSRGAEAGARLTDAAVLAIGARVADWQLSHMHDFEYVPDPAFRHDTAAPRDWIQAVFYTGLAAFADASRQPRYVDAILAHGDAEGWGFDQRPRHADADATGAVWVWAARRTGDPLKLAAIKARFDAVLANPSTVLLEFGADGDRHCQDRWCWSDALFMAPPAWFALSNATGDERYLAHADTEFWATTDLLYDQQNHLYFRDSRFITQRDAAGRRGCVPAGSQRGVQTSQGGEAVAWSCRLASARYVDDPLQVS
jgi:unsaturated rhamnogalacturonyl hydrolase